MAFFSFGLLLEFCNTKKKEHIYLLLMIMHLIVQLMCSVKPVSLSSLLFPQQYKKFAFIKVYTNIMLTAYIIIKGFENNKLFSIKVLRAMFIFLMSLQKCNNRGSCTICIQHYACLNLRKNVT